MTTHYTKKTQKQGESLGISLKEETIENTINFVIFTSKHIWKHIKI